MYKFDACTDNARRAIHEAEIVVSGKRDKDQKIRLIALRALRLYLLR